MSPTEYTAGQRRRRGGRPTEELPTDLVAMFYVMDLVAEGLALEGRNDLVQVLYRAYDQRRRCARGAGA